MCHRPHAKPRHMPKGSLKDLNLANSRMTLGAECIADRPIYEYSLLLIKTNYSETMQIWKVKRKWHNQLRPLILPLFAP